MVIKTNCFMNRDTIVVISKRKLLILCLNKNINSVQAAIKQRKYLKLRHYNLPRKAQFVETAKARATMIKCNKFEPG